MVFVEFSMLVTREHFHLMAFPQEVSHVDLSSFGPQQEFTTSSQHNYNFRKQLLWLTWVDIYMLKLFI